MKRTLSILKGCHYPISNFPFRIFCKNKKIIKLSYNVRFTGTCRYKLQVPDQYDWNKLFGIIFGLFGIHKNSFRFAWRYNAATDKIEIAKYEYVDGNRRYENICSLPLNIYHSFEMAMIMDELDLTVFYYVDNISEHSSFKQTIDKTIITAGLYFGGNRRAPHNINIKIKK